MDIDDVKGAHIYNQDGVEIPGDQFTMIIKQFIGCSYFRVNLILNTEEDGDQFTSVSNTHILIE